MQISQAVEIIKKQLNENKLVQIDTAEDSYYFGKMEQISNMCQYETFDKGWSWLSDSDMCLKKKIVNAESIEHLLLNYQRVHKDIVWRIISQDEIVYEYVKKDYNEIIPNLFMGSIEALKTCKIYDCIVNCTTNIKKPNHVTLENYFQLPWLDDRNQIIITNELNQALKTIHKWITIEKKVVLVHCEQGISRSGACVLAYLLEFPISVDKVSFETAYDFLISKRGCAKPNFGFQIQLQQWNLTKIL